jgi:vancomycin resistance protein YoaR
VARITYFVLEAGTTTLRAKPHRRSWQRVLAYRALIVVGAVAALALVVGFVFAGSSARIAAGVHIAGVDVGGLTPAQARALLERRSSSLENTPVRFQTGARSWSVKPSELGVQVDWAAAVADARKDGDGFGPVRGFRRLGVRFFGADVQPHARFWGQAVQLELARMSGRVDRAPREASVQLQGLRPVVLPAASGSKLDRQAAAPRIVSALASFDRAPVQLPVRVEAPRVTAAALAPAARQLRTALSGPVRLSLGATRWRISRFRLAALIEPPHDGLVRPRIAGSAADAYFVKLSNSVGSKPVDATFAVDGSRVRIVPGQAGLTLDVPTTAKNILAAAIRPTNRVATAVVAAQQPTRTTDEARAMGITGLVSSYETFFGGVPNRIHNVQLVSHLVDAQLISPGKEWSFNAATGARTAEKGFLTAPVIINGELQTGLGGGVCQVSTTVFNAAYEAGLKITQRTNHALYISHYPLGRDATVDYPNIDLRFVNDTSHWLLLRTFVTSDSLVVSLYGTPQHRKVESVTSPLTAVGAPPVTKVPDPELPKGKTQVESAGVPAQVTSVERKVYTPSGKLLYDDVFHSSYVAEPEILQVGTKKPPKKAKPLAPVVTTPTTPGLALQAATLH